MSDHDKTIEQACKESKQQRKEDERRGYMRAVRRMGRWMDKAEYRPWLHVDDIEQELKKMGKKG